MAAVGGPLAGPPGGRLARLRREGILGFDFPGQRPVQFGNVRPNTRDGKVQLWPEDSATIPMG